MKIARLSSGALAALWMAAIYYLSSHPMPEIDLGFSAQDKLIHLLGYGLLGALLLGAFRLRPGGYTLRQIALATLIATLYGVTDEWHQSFVPGRNSDALDVIADAVGALFGSTLLWALTRQFLRRHAV